MEIWDNGKRNNVHIIGIPEGEKSEQEIENLIGEIMTENFPNLVKQKVRKGRKHRVPIKMKPKRPTPRHIVIKMEKFKHKEKILKAAREKQLSTRELQ